MTFKKYLIRRVDPRIPDYIYSAFPSIAEDTEKLAKIYKAYRLGTDGDYAQSYFALNQRGIIVTKLTSYKIDADRKVIIALLANGYSVVIPIELLNVHDPDELVNTLKLPMELHVIYRKGYLVAEDVKLPTLKSYKDVGKEIVEEIGALNALLIGLGIMPDILTYTLYIPRLLPLFKGFSTPEDTVPHTPIHIMQLTSPNLGKTHYAIRISDIANFEYLGGELPTPARLVYDGRTLQHGIVALRDGVIFDEFDKRATQIMQQLSLNLRILLTGMEQCVWTRGSGSKSISISKCVNFVIFGNVPITLKGETTREQVINYVNISGTDAFIDRIALVDVWRERYDISKYFIHNVLPNSIMRGIIEYLQDNIKPSPLEVEIKGSREPRHAMNLKSILTNAFQVYLNDEIIAKLVQGYLTFEHVLKTTPPQTDYARQRFPDIDKRNYIKQELGL